MFLDDAIAQYEDEVGPIAARKATRTAATWQLKRVFWSVIWPAIKDQKVQVKWGWFRPSIPVSALKPLFETIFGPDDGAAPESADTALPIAA